MKARLYSYKCDPGALFFINTGNYFFPDLQIAVFGDIKVSEWGNG
jgi:hypothetical protein